MSLPSYVHGNKCFLLGGLGAEYEVGGGFEPTGKVAGALVAMTVLLEPLAHSGGPLGNVMLPMGRRPSPRRFWWSP